MGYIGDHIGEYYKGVIQGDARSLRLMLDLLETLSTPSPHNNRGSRKLEIRRP